MTPEIMNNLLLFYGIGMFMSVIIGIYEYIKYVPKDNEKPDIGIIVFMGMLSWFTVFAYVYGKLRHPIDN